MKKSFLFFLFALLALLSACASQNKQTDAESALDASRFIRLAGQVRSPCAETPELTLLDNINDPSKECKNAIVLASTLTFLVETPLQDEEVIDMTETEGQQMLDPVKIDTFDRPRLGNPDAPIEIVVFSDFQCPYCKMAAGTLKQVYEDNKDNVTLVFKHFPLSFHELAAPAALIAEAGHNDGKFWEIHDYFFENQSNLSPEMIASAVTKFGFNLNETFNSLTGKMLSDQIAKDFDDGKAANIPGTPAIFINGVFIEGGSSQIRLQMRISAEMSYENEMAAKDVPSDSPYPEFKAPYGELSNLQRKRLLSIAGDSPCPCDKPEQSLHQCAIENSCPEIAPRLEKLFQGIRENHSTMEIIRDLK